MNTRKVLAEIAGPRTERVLTEVMIVGSSHAALLTPIDTSTLINSQYRKLDPMPGGMQGKVGYTAAYAAAVHGMSGKLKVSRVNTSEELALEKNSAAAPGRGITGIPMPSRGS